MLHLFLLILQGIVAELIITMGLRIGALQQHLHVALILFLLVVVELGFVLHMEHLAFIHTQILIRCLSQYVLRLAIHMGSVALPV